MMSSLLTCGRGYCARVSEAYRRTIRGATVGSLARAIPGATTQSDSLEVELQGVGVRRPEARLRPSDLTLVDIRQSEEGK